MSATAADVLGGRASWAVECADAVEFLRALPDDSVDLLFTSPPYELARTYGIGERMVGGQAWVDWMVAVVSAAAPKVRGLVAVNCEGQTRGYAYSCVPFLLVADLHRAGFNLRKPVAFHRVGIPGSGGPDWLRNDWEPVVCVTRPGRLPWSDPTACGHPPKWAPGGEMSHRLAAGQRVNQWGMRVKKDGSISATDPTPGDGLVALATKPSHVVTEVGGAAEDTPSLFDGGERSPTAQPKNAFGVRTDVAVGTSAYGNKDGREKYRTKAEKLAAGAKRHTKRDASPRSNSDPMREQAYLPPVLANPGNVLDFPVGGGRMGHECAHENEAPFPLALAEFFVRTFCPPGGVACDPFSGSGTTCHAAVGTGRRFVGCDVRESQVDLVRRRMATVTPPLF